MNSQFLLLAIGVIGVVVVGSQLCNLLSRHLTYTSVESKKEFDCQIKNCDLTNKSLGIPVVLIMRGRSGSSSTWQIVSALAGNYTQPYSEDAGHGEADIRAMLESQDPEEDGKCWLERILCQKQHQNARRKKKRAAVIGTKLKPYFPAFNMPQMRQALQWVARNPHIKVLYGERNPLDVALSSLKHTHRPKDVKPHCTVGDTHCLAKHAERAQQLVADPQRIVESMNSTLRSNRQARDLLEELQVPRVEIRYEKLYYANNANEWTKILQFLGTPVQGLTMEKVQSKMTLAATGGQNRSAKVSNFQQIEEALKGTKLEEYLLY